MQPIEASTQQATAGGPSTIGPEPPAELQALSSQADPRREPQLSAVPGAGISGQGTGSSEAAVPPDAAATVEEAAIVEAQEPPATGEISMEEVAVATETAALTTSSPASSASDELAAVAAEPVAESRPAAPEAVPTTADERLSETASLSESERSLSAESETDRATESAPEKPRSPVERWVSPKPGLR